MIYVALLRGINVGGNNKIEMKKLKVTFENLGFTNVVTYINSGNIIFQEFIRTQEAIETDIEAAIKNDCQLDIRVVVRDFGHIEAICQMLPDTWVKNKVMRTDIMFLWKEVDTPEVLEQLHINTAVDNVKYIPGAVLWNVEDKDYNQSGMSKLVGSKIYKQMTIRNVNTVRKLHQLMS